MPGAWSLWVRDVNRELVAPIDDFTKATFVKRFNALGAWVLEGIPLASAAGQALVPGAGIIAVRDGQVVMTGPMLFPTFDWSGQGYTLTASGASDDLALWGRLCYPAAPSLVLTAAYADVRAGVAETVMKAYVNLNAGPGAAVARRWDGLVIAADTGMGAAVNYSARLDVLGDALVQMALAGGDLGFRVVQTVDGTALTFQVFAPADVSDTAKFSPALGNLARFTYSRKAAGLNHVIVGGGGDGVARTFVERDNLTSLGLWGFRLEGFKDQRQTTVVAELQQAGDEELEAKGEQVNLSLVPVDTAGVSFGVGYDVGSLVTVVVDGIDIVERVQQVEITLAGDGERILPTVGTGGAVEAGTTEAEALDVLLARMQTFQRQLARLSTAK